MGYAGIVGPSAPQLPWFNSKNKFTTRSPSTEGKGFGAPSAAQLGWYNGRRHDPYSNIDRYAYVTRPFQGLQRPSVANSPRVWSASNALAANPTYWAYYSRPVRPTHTIRV